VLPHYDIGCSVAGVPEGSINISDKLWRELTPEQVAHFAKLAKERAELFDDFAYKTYCELAKYLMAINSGAAAGLFVLLHSQLRGWHLASFFTFCAGAFFVGVAFLALSSWSVEMSEGWTADMHAWGRNEMTIKAMDASNGKRFHSWKKKAARRGLVVSFAFLIVGGVMAGIPFLVQHDNAKAKPGGSIILNLP
jgi:hypothetical protein